MPHQDTDLKLTILVIAYDEKTLSALAASLGQYSAVEPLSCLTFCEAEQHALQRSISGVLVDLATMIKSKAEEKIVAYTLTGCFPTLRVKAMGTMLVPMAMAGDAKQDKSLSDFISKTCAQFQPRRLRACRRRDICVPTYIGNDRGFTLNISWGGMFIADMNPERFVQGEQICVTLPDFSLSVPCIVARIQSWGQHRPPGIGVRFADLTQELEAHLFTLLKSDKENDRDRKIA